MIVGGSLTSSVMSLWMPIFNRNDDKDYCHDFYQRDNGFWRIFYAFPATISFLQFLLLLVIFRREVTKDSKHLLNQSGATNKSRTSIEYLKDKYRVSTIYSVNEESLNETPIQRALSEVDFSKVIFLKLIFDFRTRVVIKD